MIPENKHTCNLTEGPMFCSHFCQNLLKIFLQSAWSKTEPFWFFLSYASSPDMPMPNENSEDCKEAEDHKAHSKLLNISKGKVSTILSIEASIIPIACSWGTCVCVCKYWDQVSFLKCSSVKFVNKTMMYAWIYYYPS